MKEQNCSCFTDVDVQLPSKVRSNDAEDEWQEVEYVKWSLGELRVDGESFDVTFKPTGSRGTVKSKQLGCLIRASAVESHEGSCTLVITTSDTMHNTYRLTFKSTRDVEDFGRLAEAAEQAHTASAKSAEDDANLLVGETESKLEANIREVLTGRWPLIYGGAELYDSNESLLGRGVVVLLDPPEDTRTVGTYELLFYGEDEGSQQALKRFTIGPKMSVVRHKQSPGENCPSAMFKLADSITLPHSIRFDHSSVGAAFARDFRVRQHLMRVAGKTAASGAVSADLRDQLDELKRNSLSARLARLIRYFFVLVFLIAVLRLGTLYAEDHGARPPLAYLEALATDARNVMPLVRSAGMNAGAKACEFFVAS